MTSFADSSALVTLYVREAGRRSSMGSPLAVSELARVEVPAALWRKHRGGEIDRATAQALVAEFEADYFGTADEPPRFTAVALHHSVLDDAARLCGIHGLRAYDAVQLASALAARAVAPECRQLAAYDGALRAAAHAEGFSLIPSGHG